MPNTLRSAIYVGYILLSVIGLTMLSSVAPDRLAQQALVLFVSGLLLLYLGRQDPIIFQQFGGPLYIFTLLFLLSTFVFGDSIRGSIRWIDIAGFRLQPSELSKPLLVLSFAYFLDRYPPRSLQNVLFNFVIFAMPAALIFRQPDLGTSLVIASIWSGMIFVAGISYWLVGLATALAATLACFSSSFLQDYQIARLKTFFDPYHDPLGSGYNVIQSIIAVGSGKIIGKGLGHGTQSHFRFLPERHTDFMFASLAEELGLIGAFVVILIFAVILYRLIYVLLDEMPHYHKLIIVGVFAYLLFQVGINIGMNLGVAPVTGVTLPLISYGGSSALATGLLFGIGLAATNTPRKQHVIEIK